MTDPELVLFKQLLEAAKILHACATNLVYQYDPANYPDGWTPNAEERKQIEAVIQQAKDFVGGEA
jgi:hypothetical protein